MIDEPLLSRPASTDPGGKCTERIDVPCPSELAERLGALAALSSKSRAEYVRDLLSAHVYGEWDRIQRILRSREPQVDGTNER